MDNSTVEIRRNGRLSAGIGLVAAVMTVLYLNRAAGSGAVGDWAFCLVMAAIAISQLVSLVDARTPLLIADQQGVRIRLAQEWLGIPWAALEQVLVERRDHGLRDGRLVLRARNMGNALESLDAGARREVRWQRRLHGAPLTVPLSLGTRCSSDDLVGDLRALADRRTDVVLVTGAEKAMLVDEVETSAPAARVVEPVDDDETTQTHEPDLTAASESDDELADQPEHHPRPWFAALLSRLGGADRDIDRAEADQTDDVDDADETDDVDDADETVDADDADSADGAAARPAPDLLVEPVETPEESEPVAPAARVIDPVEAIRAARAGVRSEVTSSHGPRIALPVTNELEAAEDAEDDDELIPSGLVAPLGTVTIDDFAPVAAPEPVIGPEVRAARERAGLTIEQLSERTMVRPHVLEGIEIDDFGPCGGDFYARGHLATLARYLGLDKESLIASYDAHYSHAPINARRVFEAELATGLGGGMRTTSGGPRWSLLVAAVLSLLMIWGVARFFTDEPAQVAAPDSSAVDTAGLTGNRVPITSTLTQPRQLTVIVSGGPTEVTVRDGHRDVLWSGVLRDGARREIVGVAPFRVTADKGAHVRLLLGKADKGTVGSDLTKATRKIS